MSQDDKKIRFNIIRVVVILMAVMLIGTLAKFQLLDPFYANKANVTTLNQNIIFLIEDERLHNSKSKLIPNSNSSMLAGK